MPQTWKVLRQRQTIAPDPLSGGYGPVMEVSFVTEHGDTGIVNVPVEAYTADKVRQLIGDRVDQMNALRGDDDQ